MIETRVRVVSTHAGIAWVSASESSGCAACQAQEGCAISGLGKYLARRRPALPLAQADAQVGDELQVCVDAGELLRASVFVYLFPALLAVLAAALATLGGAGDGLAALAAVSGFAGGLIGAKYLAAMPRIHSFSTPRSIP